MKPTKCTKAILEENGNDSVVRISNQVLLRPHTNVSILVPPQIILRKHVLYWPWNDTHTHPRVSKLPQEVQQQFRIAEQIHLE